MPRIDLLINVIMTFYAKGDGTSRRARDESFTTSEELLARSPGCP